MPESTSAGPTYRDLVEYLDRVDARYYLYQQPARPWRLWHVRLPIWLHEALGGRRIDDVSGGWQLFRLEETLGDARLVRVPTPVDAESFEWTDRVPGL